MQLGQNPVSNTMVLKGTPQEFGEFIGWPDFTDERELAVAVGHLASETGVTARTPIPLPYGQFPWNLQGTWQAFAELIGMPEAVSKEDMLDAFRDIHPYVTVVT